MLYILMCFIIIVANATKIRIFEIRKGFSLIILTVIPAKAGIYFV